MGHLSGSCLIRVDIAFRRVAAVSMTTVSSAGLEIAGVREGDVLAGKYRIVRVLGAGAMGVVVAAHHMQLDLRVAIKFLLPHMLGNRDAVARFAREARAAVKITSENVARVIDVGTLETGAPYMVMEYLEGTDLATMLAAQRGPFPVEQAVDFILQACVAVAEAHAMGIVHRDLKPANLFCIRRADGRPGIKVLDFGISKVMGVGASGPELALTSTATVMGSPLYMSPEQLRSSKSVEPTSDIWAIGVILYELLAGVPPFAGDTLPEVCLKIGSETPTPLRALRPDLPVGLEGVIDCCLEKDRTRRYPNVSELAIALSGFAPRSALGLVERIAGIIESAGIAVRKPVLLASARAGVVETTIAPVGRTTTGRPGHTRVALGVISAVAVLVLVSAVGTIAARRLVRLPATTPATAPATALPSTTTSPIPLAVLAPIPTPTEPTPSPSVLADARASLAPAALAPLPRPRAVATVVPVATAQEPSKPAPTANCTPPFFFDSQGNRVFKKECVN